MCQNVPGSHQLSKPKIVCEKGKCSSTAQNKGADSFRASASGDLAAATEFVVFSTVIT